VLGCELISSVRALRMDPERQPSAGPLHDLFEVVASQLSENRADRPFDDDLATAVQLVEQGLPESGSSNR
jgi:histidine ammonia-lyase